MTENLTDKDIIISGVRYKRGSVKILKRENTYVLETKLYFLGLLYRSTQKTFDTIEAAEIAYGKIESKLYRKS